MRGVGRGEHPLAGPARRRPLRGCEAGSIPFTVGPHRAVLPTITGRAWVTGIGQYLLDPSDPYPEGFTF